MASIKAEDTLIRSAGTSFFDITLDDLKGEKLRPERAAEDPDNESLCETQSYGSGSTATRAKAREDLEAFRANIAEQRDAETKLKELEKQRRSEQRATRKAAEKRLEEMEDDLNRRSQGSQRSRTSRREAHNPAKAEGVVLPLAENLIPGAGSGGITPQVILAQDGKVLTPRTRSPAVDIRKASSTDH